MAKEQTTANGKEKRLTGAFIRDNFHIIYVEHRKYESKLEKEQAALLAKDDAMARVRRYQDDCEGHFSAVESDVLKIQRERDAWEYDKTLFPIRDEFKEAIERGVRLFDELYKEYVRCLPGRRSSR